MEKKANLQAILQEIQDTKYSDVQSPAMLIEYGFRMASYIAYTGEVCAEAKKILHDARRMAYLNVEGSLIAQERKWSISLMKDFVNDSCAKENEYYTLSDRANAACTHTLDLLRSTLSYLKTEISTTTFQSR